MFACYLSNKPKEEREMEKSFDKTIERVIHCEMFGRTKEIVKKVGPDAEAHYFCDGDEIGIYTETLEDIAVYAFSQLENFLRLADDACGAGGEFPTGHIPLCEELIEAGKSKLQKASEFLRKQEGEFQIVRVAYRQPSLEGGAFLDVQYRRGPLNVKQPAAGGA